MIKIFGQTDRDFSSNGDCVVRPLKAKVHKEDNGEYYLDLETGLEYIDFFVEGNIVVANTPTGDQAFRIGNVTKKKSKLVSKCYHVFYDSENYLIADSYVVNKTCNEALVHLNNATEPQSVFTVASDVSHVDSFRCVRKSFYEAIQTVLERWGGHLVRDDFNIQIKTSIGHDNGIIVQYKKNLKDITCSENWDNVVTKILPTGRDGIMLNAVDQSASIYITSATQYALPYTKTVSFNQDLNESDYPTEQAYMEALVADLRTQATAYLEKNCVPQVNYTLKANLEKLTDIGDVVEVIDERLSVHLMTNVIAFEYDCISGQYTDIQFGNFSQSLSGFAKTIVENTENYINSQGFTSTSWNQIQNTGTKIAEVNINGTVQNVYAPTGGGSGSNVAWTQTQNSGDKIAEIDIDGTTQNVYAPNSQTFTEALTRENIISGEDYPTIFGKIKKFFSDLKAVAFTGAYNDLSGRPTIPTKTSDLTNDSNFVNSTDLATKVDKSGDTMSGNLSIDREDGTTSVQGYSRLYLGNNIPAGTAKNSAGLLRLYGTGNKRIEFYDNGALTADRTVNFQDKSGVMALTSDLEPLNKHINIKPSTTGKSTLLQYIIDVVSPMSTSTYSFSADTFPDLPTNDWGYDVTVHNQGGLYVTAERQLSNGTIYVRGIDANSAWVDSWKTLATTSDIPDISTKVSKSGDTMTGNLNIQADLNVGHSGHTGNIDLYNTNGKRVSIRPSAFDAIVYLPSVGGTLALTSDLDKVYSTTEKKIGKWIDNRDLYEKTVELTGLTAGGEQTKSHGISNIRQVCHWQAVFADTQGGNEYNQWLPNAADWSCFVQNVSKTSVGYYMGGSRLPYISKLIVTIQYTK